MAQVLGFSPDGHFVASLRSLRDPSGEVSLELSVREVDSNREVYWLERRRAKSFSPEDLNSIQAQLTFELRRDALSALEGTGIELGGRGLLLCPRRPSCSPSSTPGRAPSA